MNKAALRQKHKDLRTHMDPALIQAASVRIQEKLWLRLSGVQSVGIYIAMNNEVQTRTLIDRLLKDDKIVCVPKIINGVLAFIRIRDLNACAMNTFGITEPLSNEPYEGNIDVQVIPMLAYNERHFRLGYGKGYYDYYLYNYSGLKLGICFSLNSENELKETQFDVKCDEIITEL